MSRSYRKHPVWKAHNKDMKTIANRKVRRTLNRDLDLNLPYKAYRKKVETYDICDYSSLVADTFEAFKEEERRKYNDFCLLLPKFKKPFPDDKELYRKWLKYRGK